MPPAGVIGGSYANDEAALSALFEEFGSTRYTYFDSDAASAASGAAAPTASTLAAAAGVLTALYYGLARR